MAKERRITSGHWLDRRRPLKDDKYIKYPIKIRVTYNRKNWFFDSGHSVVEKSNLRAGEKTDYEKICDGKHLPESLREISKDLIEQIAKAEEVGNSLAVFTWEGFKKKYFKQEGERPQDIIGLMNEYEMALRKDGRIGSADTYKATAQSLVYFMQSRGSHTPSNLPFESCTVALLETYQRWLLTPQKRGKKEKKANTLTSVGYHARNIRRIWNLEIDRGNVSRELYPFGNNKYKIPSPGGRKRSLTDGDLGKLFNYVPVEEKERMYFDSWILSFMLAGANMRDLCQLKYENIIIEEDEFKMIEYTRHKVMRTSRNSALIQIPLKGENRILVESIVKRHWRGSEGKPGDFVFRILKKGQDLEKQTALVKQHTKMVNHYIGNIAERIGMSVKPTSYHARHTFASKMARSGKSADFIRPLLGHSSVKTTEIYLSGFPDEEVASAMESIIPKQ